MSHARRRKPAPSDRRSVAPPAPFRHSWKPKRWGITVAATCVLAAATATWPLAAHVTRAIPKGTEHEATVSVFSLWTLWWAGDRALHGFQGIWDAPFFHPHKGVFAFSELLILPGAASSPLWAAGAPPAFVYNVVLLAVLALNGAFTYRLARALVASRVAALMGAVMAVTLPVAAKLSGALPVLPLFGIAWTLEGLVRFGRTGRFRPAAWGAAGFVAQYLSAQQLTIMFAPFALAAAGAAWAERRFGRQAFLMLCGAGVIAAAALAFVIVPVRDIHEQYRFQRSEALVEALSARPGDLLTRPATAAVRIPARDDSLHGDTGGLFPGIGLAVLAATGIVLGPRGAGVRRWTAYLAVTTLAAALLALGMNLVIIGWRPFATLRHVVPGLGELRAVFRFAAVSQAMLPVLAAVGLSEVSRRLGRPLLAVVPAMGLLAALENLAIPQPLVEVPRSARSGWTGWLRSQPEGAILAHIPLPPGLHVSDYEADAWRMFAQLDHRRPMINGYSSNFPPGYGRFQSDLNAQFPAYDVLCYLHERLGVNMLVIDREWLAANEERMRQGLTAAVVAPAYEDAGVRIYVLRPPPGYCVRTP